MDKKMKKLFGCPFYDVNMGSCCLGRKTASIAGGGLANFQKKTFFLQIVKRKIKGGLESV